MTNFDKALDELMKSEREPAHWKPPKWIWSVLIAIKAAALAALIAIMAVIFLTNCGHLFDQLTMANWLSLSE